MKRLIRFPGRFFVPLPALALGKKQPRERFSPPLSSRFTADLRVSIGEGWPIRPESRRWCRAPPAGPHAWNDGLESFCFTGIFIIFHSIHHSISHAVHRFFFNQLLIQMGWFIVFNNLTAFTLFQFYFMSNIPSDFKSNHQIPVYIFSFVISLIHVYNWLKWSQTFYSISGLPFLLTLK